jgi:dolichol-phosphate mannosyltransferase
LPAYNEEAAIGQVLDEISSLSVPTKVLVINNNSKDKTEEIALSKGAYVITESRQGKGYAVSTGIKAIDTPFTVMMDADGTYPAAYVPMMLGYLQNNWDIVVGVRRRNAAGAVPKANILGNSLLTRTAEVLYTRKIGDLCTGMWGWKTEMLKRANITSKGFTLEAELFVHACKGGCVVGRMDIDYRSRPNGSESHLHIKDGIKIGYHLIKERIHLPVEAWQKVVLDGKR